MRKVRRNSLRLSVVVLSYNTRDLLRDCLKSLAKVKTEGDFEIIVVDNASTDGSSDLVKERFPRVKLIQNDQNLGFAAGNNKARPYCHGEYVLLLNSDTLVLKGTLKETVRYLAKNPEIGALTCKILLPNGQLDRDARRSFPTPWVALTHLILRLDRIFPKSKLFAKYWYGYLSADVAHEVDVLQGAFFLVRKKVLNEAGWFDEDYFLDGEDIDLCWRIKERRWKIVYYPKVSIIHFKGASKGKIESQTRKKISLKDRLRYRMAGVDSMETFYKKRLWGKYPLILNFLIIFAIRMVKLMRLTRTLLLG